VNETIDAVIAVDPHKGSWAAVVVDSRHRVLGEIQVAASRYGYRELRRFAKAWPEARWAIEGVRGLGEPLARRLAEDGVDVIDIPAKLASRVRQLSTGHGRKTDQTDAYSVAVAALTGVRQPHQWNDQAETLRLLSEHRDDLVKRRTQVINRLHVLLMHLVDGGAGPSLTADRAAELLRGVRRPTGITATRRALATALVAEVRHLDRQIRSAEDALADEVKRSQTLLLSLDGVGPILAARIIGRCGPVSRFETANQFASYCGTAPLEVSSGDVVRHRLSRAGDRQLNHVLHLIALNQVRHGGDGRAYYERKRAAGKGHREAMRCLKRRLATVIHRTLVADQQLRELAAA
jgi:transposase